MNKVKSMPTFSLTKSAADRIAHLLQTETGPYFRVQVDGGGCSGFQYKFEFDREKQKDDLELRQHGVSVLIDEMSMPFLEQAQLDYKEELIGSYFAVENPNATANCGCGTSFSI
jgi:iron-sulfur cluster assembly accessory protein